MRMPRLIPTGIVTSAGTGSRMVRGKEMRMESPMGTEMVLETWMEMWTEKEMKRA